MLTQTPEPTPGGYKAPRRLSDMAFRPARSLVVPRLWRPAPLLWLASIEPRMTISPPPLHRSDRLLSAFVRPQLAVPALVSDRTVSSVAESPSSDRLGRDSSGDGGGAGTAPVPPAIPPSPPPPQTLRVRTGRGQLPGPAGVGRGDNQMTGGGVWLVDG